MATKKTKRGCPSEAAEQMHFFDWLNAHNILAFSIPNGAHSNAYHVKGLKRQGLKPGVPDLMVAIPAKRKHGLFIEMKAQDTSPSAVSPEQRYWLGRLKAQGYECHVCKGADKAIEITKEYLEMK